MKTLGGCEPVTGARQLWNIPGPEGTIVDGIAGYALNGQIFLVTSYKRGHGWDIYLPASRSDLTSATLNAAAEALGSPVRV